MASSVLGPFWHSRKGIGSDHNPEEPVIIPDIDDSGRNSALC